MNQNRFPKKWKISPYPPSSLKEELKFIDPVLLQLVYNRGLCTPFEILSFLKPMYERDLFSPFLFNEMEKAVKRIFKAIIDKEIIGIFGDYDADGVCGTVILYNILKKFGARVEIYLPAREEEGYGLNTQGLNYLINQGAKLIITVDLGIANFEEINWVQKRGIDVILTDHHLPLDDIPSAYALLNPKLEEEKYPFKNLSGSGVVFKLIQGLMLKQQEYLSGEKIASGQEKWLLDLVAIGTLADYQPLISENRVLVKFGLKVLAKTQNIGLKILIQKAGLNLKEEIKADQVYMNIVPLINVASRMDHASQAFALLISNNEEEARKLAGSLIKSNLKRQKISQKIYEEAKEQISPKDKVIFVGKPNWPLGLLGILASRLLEEYQIPVFVWTQEKDQITGSVRAPQGLDIIEVLKNLNFLLSKYGGHKQACGFSLKSENLGVFERRVREWFKDKEITFDSSFLKIDKVVKLSELTSGSFFQNIKKLEPFGPGNPYPIWAALDLVIDQIKRVGKNKHYKIWVKDKNSTLWAFIAFNSKCNANKWLSRWALNFSKSFQDLTGLKKGDKINIAFQLEENKWEGGEEITLKILDIAKL